MTMSIHQQQTSLRLLAIFAGLGALIMFAFIVRALIVGDFSDEGPLLVTMPWGLVSLVDIYLGLLLFCLWVLWREGFSKAAFAWAILILVLGNMLSCLYVLKACHDAQGSIRRFLLGTRC